MKKYILILITLILATGCSKNFAEKENRCVSYEKDIKNKIIAEVGLLTNPDSDHFWSMEPKEEFYSPKLDTCVYVAIKELYDGPTLVLQDYIVRDFYNEKELSTFHIVEQRNSTGNLGKFEDYISSLKK